FHERIRRVVNLYVRAIEVLAQRDPTPNVILCCIPQDVIQYCTVRITRGREIKRIKLNKAERSAQQSAKQGQGFLFPEMSPSLGIEDQEMGHQNLRRGLKAEAMQFGIPTQLV